MNIDVMFNPNRYSQKTMPLCSELCRIITEELVQVSDDVMEIRKRNDSADEEFFSTLSKEQLRLYEKHWQGYLEQSVAQSTENFNLGMCFGLRLAVELMKDR